MKGGAHPSPFAALYFTGSKKVHIYSGLAKFPVVGWRIPVSISRSSGNFLHHNRVALTTQLRNQHVGCVFQQNICSGNS